MSNTIVGTEGADNLQGTDEADLITGLGGNDTLYGNGGADTLDGGAGNDTLHGNDGDDQLIGGDGNDYLYAGTGADTLDGGAGSDYLDGNAGNDSYVFGRGYGQDRIYDRDYTAGNNDQITLAADIAPADVSLVRENDDLILSINGTTDTLRVHNWFSGTQYRVENVVFADGTVWDAAVLNDTASNPIGSEGNDNLYGHSGDDSMQGLGGSDTLTGFAGNDTLDGGAGNDTLHGNDGDDQLIGGDGNDYLYAGTGADTLDGGAGSDYLDGNAGNDSYVFGRGYGQDRIYDRDYTAGNNDQITLAADIAPADVSLVRENNDLILGINGTTDTLRVHNWFSGTQYRIEEVVFADGRVMSLSDIHIGTSGDDVLVGTDANSVLLGNAGNDTLVGNGGNDFLNGGEGSDQMSGGLGDDFYLVDNVGDQVVELPNEGNDTVASSIDYVLGDNVENLELSGSDALSGTGNELDNRITGNGSANLLSGGAGNDVLDGGAGDDTLQGGSGNDVYVFGIGAGRDVVIESDSTVGNIDTVRFEEGINAGDVLIYRAGSDLYLNIKGTEDTLKVSGWFADSANQIERVEFGNGEYVDAAELTTSKVAIIGTSSGDVLYGTSGDDILRGLSGNDSLYGYAGSDTLDGGAGNDYLSGGYGNDTYLFGRGAGQDTLDDYDYNAGNQDNIQLAADVAPSDVSLVRENNDLVLSINGTSDTLRMRNWFASTQYRVENVTFADGTVWDAAALNDTASNPVGTENSDNLYGHSGDDSMQGLGGNDYMVGFAGNDTLDGGAGNDNLQGNDGDDHLVGGDGGDSLYGHNGADTLDGGAGNDYLSGGYGNDTYLFGRGAGQDTLDDYDYNAGNQDNIQLAADVAPSDVSLVRENNDLVLSINGTSDTLRMRNWFASTQYRVENVTFADGTVWDAAALNDTASNPIGTENSDNLYGHSGDDSMQGLGGNDYMVGFAGNDTLDGGAGNDNLQGNDGDDQLVGGDGGDSLYGHNGADTLDGGAGNDYLSGGYGNDTYLFGRGAGQDTLDDYDYNAGNQDQTLFGADIAAEQLWFRRDGNNLEVSVIGTDDSLQLRNWYSGAQYRVEQFSTADGRTLLDSQVENLVTAMASFAPPASGELNLSQEYEDALAPVITANWQV